jgi:hypothetical protein
VVPIHTKLESILPASLLPASRKFCKKKLLAEKNWRPYGRHFWPKAAEIRLKKIFDEKTCLFLANLSFCAKIFASFTQVKFFQRHFNGFITYWMLKNRSLKKCRIFLDLAEFFLKTGRQIFLGPGNSGLHTLEIS